MEIMDLKHPFYGYAMTEDGVIYLSVIEVAEEERRKGHFRQFIDDTKKAYHTIKVPQPSPFLEALLTRYDFVKSQEFFESAGQMITVMVWRSRAR